MKRSTSSPSLPHFTTVTSRKKHSASCNALSELVVEPFLYARFPIAQVYQCINTHPPLLTQDLAICLATPPDPPEQQRILQSPFHRKQSFDYLMSRYQVWWKRRKTIMG